jgi:DNA-directed RNA polymerase specialized sigma24 family protein
MTTAPEPRAELVEALDDPAFRTSVMGYAFARSRRPQEVEDLCQEAVSVALRRAAANGWDRALYPDPFALLRSIINGLVQNSRKSAYVKRRADYDEQNPPRESGEPSDPERVLVAGGRERLLEGREDTVRQRLASELPEGLKLLECMARGVRTEQGLADELRCTVPDVRALKKRIRVLGKDVRGRMPSDPGAVA